MARIVLDSQALADVAEERSRITGRDEATCLKLAHICVDSATSGTLAERRASLVRGAAWLVKAAEGLDRVAAAQAANGGAA